MTQTLDDIRVLKRNGKLEPVDLDKIHRVLHWAAEGLAGISISDVELKAHVQFFDGIETKDIHDLLVKAAAELITAEEPDYQYFAARLKLFSLRKEAYGQFEPPKLVDHIKNMIDIGKYDMEILGMYTPEDFEYYEGIINHWNDMNYAYAAMEQFSGKYLVKNRDTGRIYETPQFINIMAPLTMFGKYPEPQRRELVTDFYQALVDGKLSLPTPIMSGVRTPTRQFSSCTLIDCDDTLESIIATTGAIVRYAAKRAGIGINAGRIRGIGSPIRDGEAVSTGEVGFLKLFNSAVGCCSQGEYCPA
ncbi:ribonucleotide-diphosphate reductase alpha subunit [Vibrio phage BONAISHI]|nr:ribonucleotide-diphosphate reductase alpha subunit [Vibrio phage BONAISHI]